MIYGSRLRWSSPPCRPPLDGDVAHVWRADLACSAEEAVLLVASLCGEEMERASGFRFEADRRRFVAARGILRDILARYCGMLPAALAFHYGSNGRPRLAASGNQPGLDFNLAHSEDTAVYAIGSVRVGVDLEPVRLDLPLLRVARRFFAPVEWNALMELPATQRPQQFFRYWTLKEAWLKAVGQGLRAPLDAVAFDLSSTPPALTLQRGLERWRSVSWSIQELSVAPGYLAALVVQHAAPTVEHWDWMPRLDNSRASGIRPTDSVRFAAGDTEGRKEADLVADRVLSWPPTG